VLSDLPDSSDGVSPLLISALLLASVERVHIETVLAEWKTWGGSFAGFCAHLKADCLVPYGSTLVSSILSSRGLRTPSSPCGTLAR